jgi:predicted metal-dependent phosphoesterase TrpH
MGLADLHMHTIYSFDGTASVEAVLKRAQRVGLDVIAITDHDEVAGALRALELAPKFGIEIIPGSEVTTAEGDLLALFVQQKIPAKRPLLETVLRVGELDGICIAPHPMAGGMGMNSLSAYSIRSALRHPEAARVLIAIEAYNATVLDRECNRFAEILAVRTGLAKVGDSDAHTLQAIGLGATEFPGHTASDLVAALWTGTTRVRRGKRLSTTQILGGWAANYLMSVPLRVMPAVR